MIGRQGRNCGRTLAGGLVALATCLWALPPASAGGADRLGEAKKTRLPNGMTVLAARNDSSDVATVDLFLRVDALREPKGRQGLRGLLQFLIVSAIQEKLKSAETPGLLAQDLEVGGALDASTDSEFVEFFAVMTTDSLEEALAQFRDVFGPQLGAEALDGAKKAALTALERQASDAVEGAYRLFRQALALGRGPAGPVLGTPPAIEAVTLDDLQAFHRRWYVPANAVVAIVSPLDPAEAIGRATKAFGNLAGGSPAGTWRPRPAPRGGSPIRAEGNSRISAASIVVGWPAPGMGSEGHEAAMVAAAVLGEGDESRLARDKELQQSRDLNYMPPLFNANPNTILAGLRDEGHIAVQTEAALWAIDDVKNRIVAQFERLKNEPVPPEELEAAKRRAINAFALQHQTTRAQAFALGRYETIGVGHQFRTKLAQRVRAVTAADVQRMARTYFDRCAIGVEMPLVESPDVAGTMGLGPSLPTSPVGFPELLQQPQ